MKTKVCYFSVFLITIFFTACDMPDRDEEAASEFPDLKGPYLGQEVPGDTVLLFARDVIFSDLPEKDVTFTWNGKLMFYTVFEEHRHRIMWTHEENDMWIEPEVASFSGEYNDLHPCLTSRGNGLYFVSNRPDNDSGKKNTDYDIWFTMKTLAGWTDPQNIGSPVNTGNVEAYPTITREGTLYFVRANQDNTGTEIFRAEFNDGKFEEPEKLPDVINKNYAPFNACISPNESYLVFCSYQRNGYGESDYYISFRNEENTWSDPVNLGPHINTAGGEYSPGITPGGKYFFFASTGNPIDTTHIPARSNFSYDEIETWDLLRKLFIVPPEGMVQSDIYWVNAKVLRKLE